MTTTQLNKLVMYLALRSYIEKPQFQAALNHLPAFRLAWDKFQNHLQEIRHRSRLSQELLSNAATEKKLSLREAMAAAGAKISAGLVTWAEIKGDIELARTAHLTRSTLLGGRALEAAIRADQFLLVAMKFVGKLDDYGVTQERVDDFDDLCQQFSDSIGRPRAIIDERKLANESLPGLFSQADEVLARLDRLSALVAEDYPAFVAGYQEKRQIIHVAATRSLSEEEAASKAERLAKRKAPQAPKSPQTRAANRHPAATRDALGDPAASDSALPN